MAFSYVIDEQWDMRVGVDSSDCFSVLTGYHGFYSGMGKKVQAIGCSSDPVVAGSFVSFVDNASGQLTTLPIYFVNASPSISVSTQVLLICFAVFLFVFGFHAGNKVFH